MRTSADYCQNFRHRQVVFMLILDIDSYFLGYLSFYFAFGTDTDALFVRPYVIR